MSENWIDESWRDVIAANVDDAIAFFMPDLAEDRDYSLEPKAEPEKFKRIGAKSSEGERRPDICMSVPLKNGDSQSVMFVVEQQHERDSEFGWRMFQEFYRASDIFLKPVVMLAIFTSNTEAISAYSSSRYGTEIAFRYRTYRIADMDTQELEHDERPFALVTLAAKRMLEAGNDPAKRSEYSLELLKLAKERNFERKKAKKLLDFIYRIMRVEKEDIDRKTKEAWNMELVPISEIVRQMEVRDVKREAAREIARKMRERNIPLDVILETTGLRDESDITALV